MPRRHGLPQGLEDGSDSQRLVVHPLDLCLDILNQKELEGGTAPVEDPDHVDYGQEDL